jgi:hypothetical protein
MDQCQGSGGVVIFSSKKPSQWQPDCVALRSYRSLISASIMMTLMMRDGFGGRWGERICLPSAIDKSLGRGTETEGGWKDAKMKLATTRSHGPDADAGRWTTVKGKGVGVTGRHGAPQRRVAP